MDKIKILEVNNIDLPGRRFNGYDMIEEIGGDNFIIRQAVVEKQSDNDSVVNILKRGLLIHEFYNLQVIENQLSMHNVFSLTTPALRDLDEYKDSDIIHFHMFHNTKLSIYSLIQIAREKKVVLTLHDPWFLTGRCVHFYGCDKWKKKCRGCNYLETLFPFREDRCHEMWELKKYVFDHVDIDIVVSSKWMLDLVKKSPIMSHQKNIHLIPFGIDLKKFNKVSKNEAREHFGFSKNEIVLFLRAQNEFKGTQYVLEALKELETDQNITVLTCDSKELLKEVSEKYQIMDLGMIEDTEMIYAMNACDIFLMPSKGESFGMMAIEAMACAKPVIVFDNTALPSVVHAPDCGVLVKDKDSHGLMKAIQSLIQDPKEREKRGKLGKKICQKEYDVHHYNESLKKMYHNVFNRKHEVIDLEKLPYKESPDLKRLFQDIRNHNVSDNSYSIDFSSMSLQEEIHKFNEQYYNEVKRKGNQKIRLFASKMKRVIKKILFWK